MRTGWKFALVTLVAGFLLGFLDFVWIKFVPFPFGGLGNSSAVWAVAAFLFAYRARRGYVGGVLSAVVLLVVAVPSYYLAAFLIQDDRIGALWSPVWTAFGVIAGVVFGAAGVTARRADRWQVAALAVPAAVLFAEALLILGQGGDQNYRTSEIVETALIDAGLGVALVLLFRVPWPRRWGALLVAVPVALVGLGMFALAGFA
ncbi:DUF6518 family protein [Cryptosporangium sp. NPDC051539]|uniref:DUF6518 family protein n=1 Tax=Cryptosporangium sp. NPDC051539 TaxID=3363962 RepID=UPI00378B7E89